MLNVAAWPAGMRVIVRKERPHPGAQLRFTDIDGHCFTCFATNTKRGQLADLELRPRRRAGAKAGSGAPRTPGSQPAPPRLCAEPAMVRDRRPGLRTPRLDPTAHPHRPSPPLGTQTPAAPAVLRRRAHRLRQPVPAVPASPPDGPGPARSPPRSPTSRPSRPADQPKPSLRPGSAPCGPVEPRPPGATARLPH
jgi:hypothetical protein